MILYSLIYLRKHYMYLHFAQNRLLVKALN